MMKRYDVPGDISLVPDDAGRYVKYADYATLEEENKRLKGLLQAANKHIQEWWRPEGELPPAKSWQLVEEIDAELKRTIAGK